MSSWVSALLWGTKNYQSQRSIMVWRCTRLHKPWVSTKITCVFCLASDCGPQVRLEDGFSILVSFCHCLSWKYHSWSVTVAQYGQAQRKLMGSGTGNIPASTTGCLWRSKGRQYWQARAATAALCRHAATEWLVEPSTGNWPWLCWFPLATL